MQARGLRQGDPSRGSSTPVKEGGRRGERLMREAISEAISEVIIEVISEAISEVISEAICEAISEGTRWPLESIEGTSEAIRGHQRRHLGGSL